jgi:hypothetical protein
MLCTFPRLQDAWVARHTCLALRYAAPHLTPSSSIQAAAAAAPTGTPAGPAAAISTNSSNLPGSGKDVIDPQQLQQVLAALVRLLVATPPAGMAANWPSAAEAAVAALYALSAQPQELLAAVLQAMFVRCKPGGHLCDALVFDVGLHCNNCVMSRDHRRSSVVSILYYFACIGAVYFTPVSHGFCCLHCTGGSSSSDSTVGGFSAAALARFFFVLGRVALQHLLCIEQIGKSIRAVRLTGDRRAAEAAEKQREAAAVAAASGASRKSSARGQAAQQQQQQQDDIGALLGVGSVAADAELDALAEAVEAQVRLTVGLRLLACIKGTLSSCRHCVFGMFRLLLNIACAS